jgi:hypothetical protein
MPHRDDTGDSSQGVLRRYTRVDAGMFYCMQQATTAGFPGGLRD